MFLPGAWKENDRLRRDASANLVDAAVACGVTKFIQESFAPTYPACGDRWIDASLKYRDVLSHRGVYNPKARFPTAPLPDTHFPASTIPVFSSRPSPRVRARNWAGRVTPPNGGAVVGTLWRRG
jgi:hypothetical protein